MNIIQKDILTIATGIIAHQANCKGSMGKGLAKQIRDKWPAVYADYQRTKIVKGLKLGMVTTTNVGENLYVANLMAQDHYYGKAPLTDYEALKTCLIKANAMADEKGLQLYLPYKIGCGLAGGDWKIVCKLIEDYAPNAIVCRL